MVDVNSELKDFSARIQMKPARRRAPDCSWADDEPLLSSRTAGSKYLILAVTNVMWANPPQNVTYVRVFLMQLLTSARNNVIFLHRVP